VSLSLETAWASTEWFSSKNAKPMVRIVVLKKDTSALIPLTGFLLNNLLTRDNQKLGIKTRQFCSQTTKSHAFQIFNYQTQFLNGTKRDKRAPP
tara:strand:- start:206 stop:487 length:282 start_codon:yes stop_codon:yes gene_type:complete